MSTPRAPREGALHKKATKDAGVRTGARGGKPRTGTGDETERNRAKWYAWGRAKGRTEMLLAILEELKTPEGAYAKSVLVALGVEWPPEGDWKEELRARLAERFGGR